MSIETTLAKLRRRNMKFSTLQVALQHNLLPTSNGWGNLERKFGELQVPAMTTASHASKLEKIYRDNVEWGDKAVQFAQFDESSGALISAAVAHTFVPEFDPSTAFPGLVSDDELAELTIRPALVSAESNNTRTGVTLYFYSRAYETERETFPVEDMTDAVSALRFAGFDQVVAYKRIMFQRIVRCTVNSGHSCFKPPVAVC